MFDRDIHETITLASYEAVCWSYHTAFSFDLDKRFMNHHPISLSITLNSTMVQAL